MYFGIYALSCGVSMLLDKLFEKGCKSRLKREGYEFCELDSFEKYSHIAGFVLKNLVPLFNIGSTANVIPVFNSIPVLYFP